MRRSQQIFGLVLLWALAGCGGDETAPTLSLSPPDGSTIAQRQVNLEATYSDDDSGIEASSFRATLDGEDVSGTFSVGAEKATSLAELENGSHTLSVSISDVEGNESSQTTSFVLDVPMMMDTDPPEISFDPVGACTGPTTEFRISYSDAGRGINEGTLTVSIGTLDVTSAFTIAEAEASAAASQFPLQLGSGTHTLSATVSDRAGNSASASLSFTLDRTPPTLMLEPSGAVPADMPIELVATYSDSGCSGAVDLSSFSASLDGTDLTSEFAIGSDRATSTRPSLGEGDYELSVSVRDTVGNETSETTNFSAFSPATSMELSLSPGPISAVSLGVSQVLSIRAMTASGRTALGFEGAVILNSSDGTEGLDAIVVQMTSADMGEKLIPVTFVSPGQVILSALSLEPAPQDFYAQIEISVVLDAPVIHPALPAMTGEDGRLFVAGYSYPGEIVGVVATTAVMAEIVAGLDGWFGTELQLLPGDYSIFVRADDPTSGQQRISNSFDVNVPRAATTDLFIEPSPLSLAVGQSRFLTVIRGVAGGGREVVTSSASISGTTGAVTIGNDGLITATQVGADTLIAAFDGVMAQADVEVLSPALEYSSPAHGEADVAVTRETVLQFSAPLDPATVTDQSIYAEFGGDHLSARLHVSADQRRVTMFYADSLPPSARVRVTVNGDLIQALGGLTIDATGDGVAGGEALIDFDTLSLTVVPGTSVVGRVFASEIVNISGGSMNVPLAGVRITVDGAESVMFADTDAMGNFRLDPAPAGRFFVHIDGRTATNGVPAGAYYPYVGKPWESVPEEETNVGNVHLPLVNAGSLQAVSDTVDTTITFAPSVMGQFPELSGTELIVPAGALFDDNCPAGGSVGIAPVDPERLPGTLPEGLDFALVITVQTDCATNFDQPVGICLPNLEGLPPGAETALWSFNHDTGTWEVQGSMHVTSDGQRVCSDPNVGVRAPGWHGSRTAVRGDGGEGEDGDGGTRTRGNPSNGETRCRDCDSVSVCLTCPHAVLLHNGEERRDEVDLRITGRGGHPLQPGEALPEPLRIRWTTRLRLGLSV